MTSATSRRDHVLAAIQESPEAVTVPQLAETCRCAEVSVRRHLRALLADGLIEHVGNMPSYDDRDRLRWGRGPALYVPKKNAYATS